MQRLCIKHGTGEYFITVGEGLLSHADEYMNLSRKALIVTDSGVPREYAEAVLSKCLDGEIITVDEGESSKSFERLSLLIDKMLGMGMDRTGCVIAVGGGVVGDPDQLAPLQVLVRMGYFDHPPSLLSRAFLVPGHREDPVD